jgi:hypothetical protein
VVSLLADMRTAGLDVGLDDGDIVVTGPAEARALFRNRVRANRGDLVAALTEELHDRAVALAVAELDAVIVQTVEWKETA